jgi:hypothetical protein
MLNSFPFSFMRQPVTRRTSAIVRISFNFGALPILETPFASIAAAITGSTAFLEPEISTEPLSGPFDVTKKESMWGVI